MNIFRRFKTTIMPGIKNGGKYYGRILEAVFGVVCNRACRVHTALDSYLDFRIKRRDRMRLDKFFSDMGVLSRSECKRAVRSGAVSVNGRTAQKSDMQVDPGQDEIIYKGERIGYERFTYIMLNKPKGYISATDDKRKKTVLDLLEPRLAARELFPCGRLDIDTTGLLILTNDGQLAHALLSPKHHAEKVYRFECESRLPEDSPERVARGLVLDDGYECLSASLVLDAEGNGGKITLREGKFHQIKRMAHTLGSEIVELERIEFGGVPLDPSLERGEYRALTDEEIALLERYRI